MSEIIQVFSALATQYGEGYAVTLFLLGTIIFIIYKIVKNSSTTITKYIEHKLFESEEKHKKAACHRKNITPEIRNTLSNMANECNCDRAILFEYSNGNSNLIGLPFLYLSATCEVLTAGTSSVATQYQRMNTSILAQTLEEMEDKGVLFYENIKTIQTTNPLLYHILNLDNVHSALFYPLVGFDNSIGFLLITTVNDNILIKQDSLPRVAMTAQKIMFLLNYNKINE